MKIWTAQMGMYRRLKKLEKPYTDTTVKSGNKAFAPRWEMVLGHKDGSVSDAVYTAEFQRMMDHSQVVNQAEWDKLLLQEEVYLLCYCTRGKFCHRLQVAQRLKEYAEAKGVEAVLMGEFI